MLRLQQQQLGRSTSVIWSVGISMGHRQSFGYTQWSLLDRHALQTLSQSDWMMVARVSVAGLRARQVSRCFGWWHSNRLRAGSGRNKKATGWRCLVYWMHVVFVKLLSAMTQHHYSSSSRLMPCRRCSVTDVCWKWSATKQECIAF